MVHLRQSRNRRSSKTNLAESQSHVSHHFQQLAQPAQYWKSNGEKFPIFRGNSVLDSSKIEGDFLRRSLLSVVLLSSISEARTKGER